MFHVVVEKLDSNTCSESKPQNSNNTAPCHRGWHRVPETLGGGFRCHCPCQYCRTALEFRCAVLGTTFQGPPPQDSTGVSRAEHVSTCPHVDPCEGSATSSRLPLASADAIASGNSHTTTTGVGWTNREKIGSL